MFGNKNLSEAYIATLYKLCYVATYNSDSSFIYTQVYDSKKENPLREGDKILSINNKVTRTMNPYEIDIELKQPILSLVIERYVIANACSYTSLVHM